MQNGHFSQMYALCMKVIVLHNSFEEEFNANTVYFSIPF